ncbi:MAG: N-ATPase, AtpR subunit [Rhodobacteraceae bacterium HLUCCO18]|nr:MAG: N-ATPase, AtpR subunit [Rhodobacteraceae bacterium HLUCCO18]
MMAELSILAAGCAGGVAFGLLYLALLKAGTRAIAGPRPALAFTALAALRAILVVGAVLGALALGAGAGALVAGLAGFVLVRVAATRRARTSNVRASGGGQAWK